MTNNGVSTPSTSGQEHQKVVPTSIPPTGTTSKIMHPSEDLSLEEIRARKPKYLKQVTTARANAIFASSSQQQKAHHLAQQQQHHQQQQQHHAMVISKRFFFIFGIFFS